jgi:hypothetical protein
MSEQDDRTIATVTDDDVRRAAAVVPHEDAGCSLLASECQQRRLATARQVLAVAAPEMHSRWVAEAFEAEAERRARGSFVNVYLRRLAQAYRNAEVSS